MSAVPWNQDKSSSYPRARRRNQTTRTVVNTAPRVNVIAVGLARILAFAVLAAASYGISSLLGHSKTETAYRDRMAAVSRIESAQRDVERLQKQVSALTARQSIERWAMANGLYKPGDVMLMSGGENAETETR